MLRPKATSPVNLASVATNVNMLEVKASSNWITIMICGSSAASLSSYTAISDPKIVQVAFRYDLK